MEARTEWTRGTGPDATSTRVTECVICGLQAFSSFADLGSYSLLFCRNCKTLLKNPPSEDSVDNRIPEYEQVHQAHSQVIAERIISAVEKIRPGKKDCLD